MGVTISNMVMFGLILAVGMLVDGAIVVVEYADKRIAEGTGPMSAYVEAAKRMFWPVASSTATTLCAFLPMLFWPGVPGQFMGMLPVTLIFVLSASLIVALIFLPIIGGVSGRLSRMFENASNLLRKKLPWIIRAALVPLTLFCLFCTTMQLINPSFLMNMERGQLSLISYIPGGIGLIVSAFLVSITMGAAEFKRERQKVVSGYRRTLFGRFIKIIVGNPIMPLAAIGGIIFLTISVFTYFGQNNYGVEFFVESEPEQAIVYVRARGNLSLQEKDDIVREAEKIV